MYNTGIILKKMGRGASIILFGVGYCHFKVDFFCVKFYLFRFSRVGGRDKERRNHFFFAVLLVLLLLGR